WAPRWACGYCGSRTGGTRRGRRPPASPTAGTHPGARLPCPGSPGFWRSCASRLDRDRLLALAAAGRRPRGVARAHVVVDDRLELLGDALALERHRLLAIHVDRGDRLLARPRQRDADVGELRFARAVHDATHHRDVHLLHARILRAP